jgi:hypothetical protein
MRFLNEAKSRLRHCSLPEFFLACKLVRKRIRDTGCYIWHGIGLHAMLEVAR